MTNNQLQVKSMVTLNVYHQNNDPQTGKITVAQLILDSISTGFVDKAASSGEYPQPGRCRVQGVTTKEGVPHGDSGGGGGLTKQWTEVLYLDIELVCPGKKELHEGEGTSI